MISRKIALASMTLLTLLTLTFSIPVHARPGYITADIPYDVIVGNTRLPAGEYDIREIGFPNRVIQIFNNDEMMVETLALPVSTEATQVPEHTKLVLQKVGDDYFLDKIWIQGRLIGYQFVRPSPAKPKPESDERFESENQ